MNHHTAKRHVLVIDDADAHLICAALTAHAADLRAQAERVRFGGPTGNPYWTHAARLVAIAADLRATSEA